MLAAAPTPIAVTKPPQPVTAQTAHKTTQPQAPETVRTSAGEASAANVRAETARAVQPAEQSTVAPRLRDQERAETTNRAVPGRDIPAGPPPAFEESPLERQARVALDPPDLPVDPASATSALSGDANEPEAETRTLEPAAAEIDPPPTPTERAEASFAETLTMADKAEPTKVDVRN